MSQIAELIAQRESIERQIKELRKTERQAALMKIRELIAEFDLSADEIIGKAARGRHAKVPPKYRDPQSGKTWTGRGRSPRWLDGRNAADFLIK